MKKTKKELLLEEIRECPFSAGEYYRNAHHKLQRDRDVVLVLVKRNGDMLKVVPEIFKRDIEVVKIAVASDGMALEYAHQELRKNSEVAVIACNNDVFSLEFVDESLGDDAGFMFNILKGVNFEVTSYGSKSPFLFASRRLQNDKVFLLNLAIENPDLVQASCDGLKNDKDLTEMVRLSKLHQEMRYVLDIFNSSKRYSGADYCKVLKLQLKGKDRLEKNYEEKTFVYKWAAREHEVVFCRNDLESYDFFSRDHQHLFKGKFISIYKDMLSFIKCNIEYSEDVASGLDKKKHIETIRKFRKHIDVLKNDYNMVEKSLTKIESPDFLERIDYAYNWRFNLFPALPQTGNKTVCLRNMDLNLDGGEVFNKVMGFE